MQQLNSSPEICVSCRFLRPALATKWRNFGILESIPFNKAVSGLLIFSKYKKRTGNVLWMKIRMYWLLLEFLLSIKQLLLSEQDRNATSH